VDEKEHLSPEERLLRLIRRRKPEEPKKEQGTPEAKVEPAKKAPEESGQEAQPQATQEKNAPAAGRVEGLAFKSPEFVVSDSLYNAKFKIAEYALGAVFCLLTAYLIFDISITGKNLLPDVEISAKKGFKFVIPELKLGPYSDYSRIFAKRNLFIWRKKEEATGPNVNEEIAKSLSTLSLMGVVDGATKQAIIFDKATQKSYFLNKGDEIGIFRLNTIEPGKVILEYKDQQVELFI